MDILIYGIISVIAVGLALVGIACVMMAARSRTDAEIAEDDEQQMKAIQEWHDKRNG